MLRICRVTDIRCHTEELVRRALMSRGEQNSMFITPEFSKAQIERIVMDIKQKSDPSEPYVVEPIDGGTIRVLSSHVDGDVLSFMRLASGMLDMCGVDYKGAGDKVTVRNAVYKILSEHISEFKTLGKLVGRVEYVDLLINLMDDFMRYGIGEDHIAKALEDADEDGAYADKLYDYKLLTGYMNDLNHKFGLKLMSDPIVEACALLERISDNRCLLDSRRMRPLKNFLNSRFDVIGFGAVRLLTPLELKLVSLMSGLGAYIVFYPLCDDEEGELKLFRFGNDFVRELISSGAECAVEDMILDKESDSESSKGNILKNACREYALEEDPEESSDHDFTDDIVRVSLDDIDDQVAYISNEIIRLTREEGMRYRDIRIVCVDDALVPGLKDSMSDFGLDMFIDRKIVLTNTPVFRYLSLLLELPVRNYELRTVLKLLRTGLGGVLPEIIDALDNYCVRYNITDARRLFDREYFVSGGKYPMMILAEGKKAAAAQYLWENVIERVLIPIRDDAAAIYQAKTIKYKALCAAEHLEKLIPYIKALAGELYDRGDTDRASALVRGYNEVMTLMSAFNTDMNDTPVSQENFIGLIRIDMRNKAEGSIPLKVDSVEIITPAQAYMTKCKVLFVLGASSDNFPYSRVSEGLLTVRELKRISESSGIFLPDKAQNMNRSEFVTSALMFNAVSKRLYFVGGKDKEPSVCELLIGRYSSSVLQDCFKTPVYGTAVKRRHDFTSSRISLDNMDSLIDQGKRISVSSLEKFNECPMKYMLSDVLSINKREDNTSVQANSMGTIIHAMFEYALQDIASESECANDLIKKADELGSDGKKLHDLARQSLLRYVSESDKAYEKTPEYLINPGLKAMRIFSVAMPPLLKEAGENGFMPEKFELNIGKLEPQIRFTDINGREFKFVGYVDRADRSEADGSLRIIDYKTGSKKIDISKTLQGLQIQLWAYADAIERIGEEQVNDVGYFEIGLSAKKEGKFKPLVLAPEFAHLPEDDMKTVKRFVRSEITESINMITSGVCNAVINSKSIEGQRSPCSYCIFSGACGNDRKRPVNRKRIAGKSVSSSDGKAVTESPMETMARILKEREENE